MHNTIAQYLCCYLANNLNLYFSSIKFYMATYYEYISQYKVLIGCKYLNTLNS